MRGMGHEMRLGEMGKSQIIQGPGYHSKGLINKETQEDFK